MRAGNERRATGSKPMPGSRRLGLVLPVFLAMIDALVILSIIAEGRRCDSECASTVLVLGLTPVFGPLALAGIGEPVHPSLSAVALAYLVVIVAVFFWWRFLTDRLAGWAAGRRGSVLHFAGGYVLALVATALLRTAFFPVQDVAGAWAAFVVEIALAAFVAWWVSRVLRPAPPPSGCTDVPPGP